MALIPKGWTEFQHYKNRSPIWIKLHRRLLDDFTFSRLPLASKALAPMLWLLASEYEDGKITASIEEIAFRFRMTEDETRAGLKPLIECGLFADASNTLAGCKQVAILEKRREEIEEEKIRREDAPHSYAFKGEVIRLRHDAFDRWVKAYQNLDLLAELTARDAWLSSDRATDSDRKNWFASTSQHLANRNRDAKVKLSTAKIVSDSPYKASHIEGVN